MKNGIINSYPSLTKNVSCDVLIIGGGLTGALMSYQFSKEGYKTILIDKRDIGTGSTSANTSMVQYEIDEPLYGLIEMVGKEAAVNVYKACEETIYKLDKIVDTLKIDCDFKLTDSLLFAKNLQDADGLKRELACRKMAGLTVKWLNADQIYKGYGILSEGGILSETAARMDAYRLTHALIDHSVKKFGAKVFDHTAVASVENMASKNYVTVDTSAVIESNFIVYATGYETQELIGKKIGKLVSTYACISEPLTNLPMALNDAIFWDTGNPYCYFRTTPDNRILIGGEDENFKDPEKRDALIEKKESQLVSMFHQCVPGMDFVPDFTWAGTFGQTKDTLPYIGLHPDFPNSYFALGFGGNGITFSVMAMEILSDAVAKRHNKFLEYFGFNR